MKDLAKKPQRLTSLTRLLIFVCGLMLIVVLFVPLWQIDLDAPQYPEGLELIMYPNRLAGDVEVINGLNHYIGMKTLHTEDFVEFKVLPYIIIFFAAFCFLAALLKRKSVLGALTISFALFGIVAMVDFWKWEYDYGHNLDPNAAIQVPGMSYQPPLIGFKQLLNFGAYSMPALGGILFFAVGLILLSLFIYEISRARKFKVKGVSATVIAGAMVLLSGCSTGPQPIRLGNDACDFCRMTISVPKFGAEVMTKKGKAYKFDDLHCLLAFLKEKNMDEATIDGIYVVNFTEPHQFIHAPQGFYLKHADLRSPMGSNVATFVSKEDLEQVKKDIGGEEMSWEELKNES